MKEIEFKVLNQKLNLVIELLEYYGDKLVEKQNDPGRQAARSAPRDDFYRKEVPGRWEEEISNDKV